MPYLEMLVAWFERIPATLWGVIFGSFFSLGGVYLTNRANDRRLASQLAHDRELKNRERELSMRKDVYLAAAEAISEGMNVIGRFADLNIPHEKLTERYVEKSAAIAKVHVIAKAETAGAIAEFTSELGAAYLRLFVKRYPLSAQRQQMLSLSELMQSFAKERDRMVELMKQLNLKGRADQRQWDFLQNTFQFEQNRFNEASEQHKQLSADLWAKQMEYMQECQAEIRKLRALLLPALAAARAELELPIDQAAYTKLVEESVAKDERKLKEFLEKVHALSA